MLNVLKPPLSLPSKQLSFFSFQSNFFFLLPVPIFCLRKSGLIFVFFLFFFFFVLALLMCGMKLTFIKQTEPGNGNLCSLVFQTTHLIHLFHRTCCEVRASFVRIVSLCRHIQGRGRRDLTFSGFSSFDKHFNCIRSNMVAADDSNEVDISLVMLQ